MKDAENQPRSSIRKKGDEQECELALLYLCQHLTASLSDWTPTWYFMGPENFSPPGVAIFVFLPPIPQRQRALTQPDADPLLDVCYGWTFPRRESRA